MPRRAKGSKNLQGSINPLQNTIKALIVNYIKLN
jgi:hypothetical protein